MCTFGVLGLSCEASGGPEAAGASHDSPRAQTCTFHGPGLQTPPRFNEKTPRDRKRAKWWREREKKERNFGRSGGGGPVSGGLAQGPGESKPTTTTTTITTTTPTSPEMEGGGQTRNNCGFERRWEGARRGSEGRAPKGRAPSLRVWGLGLWDLGFWFECWFWGSLGFRQFGQNTKTLKLAKVGFGQSRSTH